MEQQKFSMCHRNLFWPTFEENLCRCVKMQREAGNPVSMIKIWLKAKIMASEIGIVDFKRGSSWCYQFMRRNNLRVRMKTTVR